MRGEFDLASGFALVLKPNEPPRIAVSANSSPVLVTGGRGGLRLTYGAPNEATRLVGIPGGSRLEALRIYVGGGVEIRDGQPDAMREGGVNGGRIVITLSEADGFLGK